MDTLGDFEVYTDSGVKIASTPKSRAIENGGAIGWEFW